MANIRPADLTSRFPHVGLQLARQFSSTRLAFGNLVTNAPLFFRAVGNELDLNDVDDTIEKPIWCRNPPANKQMSNLNASSLVASVIRTQRILGNSNTQVPEIESSAGSETFFRPIAAEDAPSRISILIPVHPESPSDLQDASESDRILSSSFLKSVDEIQNLHLKHSTRNRNLVDRLRLLGAIKSMSLVDLDGTRHFVLDLKSTWSREDARQALSVLSNDEMWFQVVDWEEVFNSHSSIIDSTETIGTVSNTASHSTDEHGALTANSNSFSGSAGWHDNIVNSLDVSSLFFDPILSSGRVNSDRASVAGFLAELDSLSSPAFLHA